VNGHPPVGVGERVGDLIGAEPLGGVICLGASNRQ
jgi:hypothetical protein